MEIPKGDTAKWEDLQKFLDGKPCGNPSDFDPEAIPKGKPFKLYRGMTDRTYMLQSTLERVAKKRFAGERDKRIGRFEKDLVEHFLSLFGCASEIQHEATWLFTKKRVSDAFYLLSVMQHYGLPTRLLDFTASLPMALFFATDGWKGGEAAVYQLRCKNEYEGDSIPCCEIGKPESPNKLPRDCDWEPWRAKDNGSKVDSVDMNDFLGRTIEYAQYDKAHKSPIKSLDEWREPKKRWGWDAPYVRNPRIAMQQGFFVYNVDVTRSIHDDLEEALEKDKDLIVKYVINANLIAQIWEQLAKREIVRWRVYWDVELPLRDMLSDVIANAK